MSDAQLAALVAVVSFFLGFAPPSWDFPLGTDRLGQDKGAMGKWGFGAALVARVAIVGDRAFEAHVRTDTRSGGLGFELGFG